MNTEDTKEEPQQISDTDVLVMMVMMAHDDVEERRTNKQVGE